MAADEQPADVDQKLRELALIDRVIGLEAELAELAARRAPRLEALEDMRRQLAAAQAAADAARVALAAAHAATAQSIASHELALVQVRSSTTWRIGRLFVAPFALIRRPFRRHG